jgi:hypothetical protein
MSETSSVVDTLPAWNPLGRGGGEKEGEQKLGEGDAGGRAEILIR